MRSSGRKHRHLTDRPASRLRRLAVRVAHPPRRRRPRSPATDRADTILVVLDDDEPSSTWAKAAHLGVDQLAVLPAAAEWLSGRMIAAVEPPTAPGTTVGVVAGCGEPEPPCSPAHSPGGPEPITAPSSSTPTRSAGTRPRPRCRTGPGPRWTDLSASRGQLRPSTLAEALPRHDGLALLSWGETTPSTSTRTSSTTSSPRPARPSTSSSSICPATPHPSGPGAAIMSSSSPRPGSDPPSPPPKWPSGSPKPTRMCASSSVKPGPAGSTPTSSPIPSG